MTAGGRAAGVALICLPAAGGTPAAYQGWPGALSPGIDVRPVPTPRPAEMANPSVQEAAAVLAGKIGPAVTGPYAFFGHSLGAIVAFETIRALLDQGFPPPVRLFGCGSAAPHVEAARSGDLHRLPDGPFLEEVARLGGLPPEVSADPELREAFLPGLRADYMLAETYACAPGPPLPCPVSVFHGQSDPLIDPEGLQPWAEYTTAGLTVRTVPGDHFLLQTSAAYLHRAIRKDLGG